MTQMTEHAPPYEGGAAPALRRRIAPAVKIFLAVLWLAAGVIPESAHAGKYTAAAWDGKFRYGAYSTLISSYVLGVECRINANLACYGLIDLLNDPHADLNSIDQKIVAFKERYETLSDDEIDNIIAAAKADQTNSIYEEERSVVSNIMQNNAFIQGMIDHPGLAPVDGLVNNGAFTSKNFQFSVHRALYNDAYGIPQNSLAAIVNAYVAGIRNVEFDVLDTRDNVSILIHDLVTNRIEGDYMGHPNYVEDRLYDDVKDTRVNVLNPIANAPETEDTQVRMITTERVLEVVHNLMPGMTLYLDARNNAPLSIINLLYVNPKYKNNVVLKIYPFLLSGGMTDLVKRYADRYEQGYEKAARDEIAAVQPNVLLAIGHAEMEANQDAAHTGIKDFTWDLYQQQTNNLPFSHNATASFNSFNNQAIFTEEELNEIEMRTFLLFRWAMGLTGITNTLVFQMAAIPSLTEIVLNNNQAEFTELGQKPKKEDLISAAAHDNFITLYKMVMSEQLVLDVDGCVKRTCGLKDRIAHTQFGLSDRYPDFAFADRQTKNGNNDTVNQGTLKNFNYSMLGTAYKNDGYQPGKVRSTKAIMARIAELKKITESSVIYITTDLEVDLRLAFMGLLGQEGLPKDIRYRAGGVIKEGLWNNQVQYVIQPWLSRLSGTMHSSHPNTYKDDLTAISNVQKSIDQLRQLRHSLQRTYYDDLPLTNKDAWTRLGINKAATLTFLKTSGFDLKETIDDIGLELANKQREIQQLKRTFEHTYGIRFISERSIEPRE